MTAPLPDHQRRALADFLRAHRTRLQPDRFGLPAGARRRTPGLRREEVAQLSGMSATWYAWIEQAREVSVSPDALARLARTLGLSGAERAYLFDLAGKRDPRAEPPDGTDRPPAALAGALDAIALPAYLLDRNWTACAWNAAARHVFVGWLDHDGDKNLLRYVFLKPDARALICDWPDRARRLLAEFRADHSRHLDDAALRALVEDLRARSLFFAQLWDEQSVTTREGGERTFDHPADGRLGYEQISLALAGQPDIKLVLLVPAGAAGHPTLPAGVPLKS